MRRRRNIILIGCGLMAFLLVSALLGRIFTVDSAEQAAVTGLLSAEGRGDAAGVVARIDGCRFSPACRAGAGADAAQLRRPGAVVVVHYTPSATFSLGSTVGVARVAFTIGGSKPIVQCVRIRRAGNPVSGVRIELLVLSRRIPGGADCPKRL